MKMKLLKLPEAGRLLCWIRVNNREALALIESLVSQLQSNNPNSGRLESNSTGDCNELSICVMGKEIPE